MRQLKEILEGAALGIIIGFAIVGMLAVASGQFP